MFKPQTTPDRPAKFIGTAIPNDVLPITVILFDDSNRDAVKQLIGNLSSESIDAFIKANSNRAFTNIGRPYGAYDGPLPSDPVAQIWQRNTQDAGSLIVVRRIGNGQFRVQAREGSNALILHTGDPAYGKKASALLCVTLPNRPSQFMKAGDSIFEGAVFLQDPQATAEFQHIKDHMLHQCNHCTAGNVAVTPKP